VRNGWAAGANSLLIEAMSCCASGDNANRYYRYVFANFRLKLQGAWNGSGGGSEVRSIPTYLSLLIFGFIYQLVLVYDALANKNTIQVIGLCLMNLGILVYTAIQIDQIKDATNALVTKNFINSVYWDEVQPYLIALPCIIALGSVLLSFIAWKLYDEFAWTIYKQISADLRLKRRYLVFQVSQTRDLHGMLQE
jgi:hypothetical protein